MGNPRASISVSVDLQQSIFTYIGLGSQFNVLLSGV